MGKRVAQTRMAWEVVAAESDQQQRTAASIAALARQHGIESRYGRRKPLKAAKKRHTADQRNGECRTLDSAEIAALDFEPSN